MAIKIYKNQAALGRRRPADTFLHSAADVKTASNQNVLQVALDVGIINAQASSHVSTAASGSLKAAEAYTRRKRGHNDTDRLCREVGIDYQPLVWESFGGLALEGRQTLKSINRLVAFNTNTPTSEVARRFWQRVSVEIQKMNHRAFAKRVSSGGDLMCESASGRFLRTCPGEGKTDWI